MVDSNGIIWAYAGTTAGAGSSGDGGPATLAGLRSPYDVQLAADGSLTVVDFGNHAVRSVNASGFIRTIVGTLGVSGSSGDGGPATLARLSFPKSAGYDAAFNLFLVDSGNNREDAEGRSSLEDALGAWDLTHTHTHTHTLSLLFFPRYSAGPRRDDFNHHKLRRQRDGTHGKRRRRRARDVCDVLLGANGRRRGSQWRALRQRRRQQPRPLRVCCWSRRGVCGVWAAGVLGRRRRCHGGSDERPKGERRRPGRQRVHSRLAQQRRARRNEHGRHHPLRRERRGHAGLWG
jgi:hypothetical protein